MGGLWGRALEGKLKSCKRNKKIINHNNAKQFCKITRKSNLKNLNIAELTASWSSAKIILMETLISYYFWPNEVMFAALYSTDPVLHAYQPILIFTFDIATLTFIFGENAPRCKPKLKPVLIHMGNNTWRDTLNDISGVSELPEVLEGK